MADNPVTIVPTWLKRDRLQFSHRDDEKASYTYVDRRHFYSDRSAVELDDPA